MSPDRQVTSSSHPVSAHLTPVVSSSLSVGSFPVVSSSLSVVSSSFVSSVASSMVPGMAPASSTDVASCSFSTGSSWSLPSVVVCSASSAPCYPPPASSFLPPFLVAGSSSFPAPPVSSFSFVNPVASSAALPGGYRSSPGLGAGAGPFLSSLSPGPCVSIDDSPGTSGTMCSLSDVDPAFDKGDTESSLAKGEFSKSFQEMIALITSYFFVRQEVI